MFNTKAKRIAELEEVLGPLTSAAQAALERLQLQQAEITELKDDRNAQNLVLAGATAKIEAQARTIRNQTQVILDLAEQLAELQLERDDLAVLVDEYRGKDLNSYVDLDPDPSGFKDYDPTREPFA